MIDSFSLVIWETLTSLFDQFNCKVKNFNVGPKIQHFERPGCKCKFNAEKL